MIIIVINHADDILRRRGYSNHFDTMCVSVYMVFMGMFAR